MMAKIKLAVTVTVATAIALSIVGCTSNTEIRNRSNDYLYSEEVPEMQVPDGKDDTAVGELYVIPDIPIGGLQATTFNVPRPQPPSENLFEESVKIQSFDGKRWISINKPPAEVWPRLRNILTRSRVPTTRTDAPNGILETGWLQFKDDINNSHRFRFIIVPGVGIKSTEIQLTQMEVASGSESSVNGWPEISMSDSKEEDFTKIVANALASDINSGSVSLLAQNIGGESKVEVLTPENEVPYISMELGYDRAWASVMDSLSLGGFSVVDQNQSGGVVLVDFDDTPVVDDDDTLFGLISGFLNEDDEQELKTLEYKVNVIQGEKSVEVRIMKRDGRVLDSLLAAKLLKVIRANLT